MFRDFFDILKLTQEPEKKKNFCCDGVVDRFSR